MINFLFKISLLLLLSIFLMTSCSSTKKTKPVNIPYHKTDYNGIFKLDSLGKTFSLKNDFGIEKYTVTKEDAVALENIKKATVTFSKYTNSPAIIIVFDSVGAIKLSKLTKNNIGKQLAIIFANKLIICPKVQSVISKGKLEISGNLSLQEATNIVTYINANK